MADRITLEDKLLASGKPTGGRHACPNCGRLCRAFEIVAVRQAGHDALDAIETDFACTQCTTDAARDVMHDTEQAALAELAPWDSPAGVEQKMHRDRTLDRWRWTVLPDSPLTGDNQTAWLAYLAVWHRMTVDAATPADFIEPEQPAMQYAT